MKYVNIMVTKRRNFEMSQNCEYIAYYSSLFKNVFHAQYFKSYSYMF